MERQLEKGVPLFLDGDLNDAYNTYFMGVIYKITNLINGKIYIGRTINKYTTYIKNKLHSIKHNPNKHLAYAVEKYGISNFSVKVIDVARTVKDLDALEIEHIKKEMSTDPNIGYNISLGGTGGPNFKGHKHTEASKIKMRQNSRHYSANKGKKLTEGWKENIRLAMTGIVHSDNWNQNIGKALKGLPKSSEHRKKLSLANKGKKLTEETRQKLREKHKTRNYCNKKIIDLSNVVVIAGIR